MIIGKQLGKRLRNCLLYLTAFTVCMTSIPFQSVQAAETAAVQSETTAEGAAEIETSAETQVSAAGSDTFVEPEVSTGESETSAEPEASTGESETSVESEVSTGENKTSAEPEASTGENKTSAEPETSTAGSDTSVESDVSTEIEKTAETEVSTELETVEEPREYTAQELYEIDGGDGEYWKHYDAEGNAIEQEEDGGIALFSARSISGKSLVSPYTNKTYTVLSGYDVSYGIDVSKYQLTIDWNKVKADGIDSVIIRCAYRGYGTAGTLINDIYFEKHIKDALAAGLHVGAYIYSQATTEAEGREEAQKCLDLCEDYLDQMDLPIVMDVEYAYVDGAEGGRLYDANLSQSKQTAICRAFADIIYEAGYQSMIYANKSYLTDQMNASSLTDEGDQIWLAHYTTGTSYSASPYIMWQYSSSGSVKGISGRTDVNFIFTQDLNEVAPVWKEAVYSDINQSIFLSWENATGVDGYQIERSTDGTNWSVCATIEAGAAVSYTDSFVTSGNTYYYRMRTYITENGTTTYSPYSDNISVNIPEISDDGTISGMIELAAPTLKSASSQAYNSIKVSWGSVSGAEGYEVYRKVSGGEWQCINQDTTGLTYTDQTAVTGTTYYYTVRAYYQSDGNKIPGKYNTAGISGKAIPATPTLSSTASKGYNSINVTWKQVAGATGYGVYRKVSGGSWSKIADNVTALNYTDKTAACGTTYYYSVQAYRTVNGTKVWGKYNTTGISGKAIPSTPTIISAVSQGYKKIKFSWNKVSGATGYRVYRKVSGGSWLYLGDTTTALSYTDEWITTGKTYYYTVRAYRTVNGTRIWGNYNTTGVSGKAVPAAPSLKSASSTGYKSIKLTWGKVSGATGYRVYRKVSGGRWTKLKDTTSVTYTDNTATTGKTYYYMVKAYRTVNGTKVWGKYNSSGISGKAVPAAPSLKSASSTGYKSIKLTWGKVSGATGYRVYRKVSGGRWTKLKDTTSVTYTDNTATTGKTYYYMVKAYRTVNGTKVWGKYNSSGISGKAIPSTPSFKLSSTSKGKVRITWSKVSGASGYVIYRKNLSTGKWETIKTITSGSTVSYTASGTSKKKVYYSVRAYRTVSGKRVYSKYKTNIGITVK